MDNPGFYKELHLQVHMTSPAKKQLQEEAVNEIPKIRQRLVSHASGDVLETCIGENFNKEFYSR